MSESVHVVRVRSLPDNQRVAIASKPDGAAIIYIHIEQITAEGALALESALTASRADYERWWRGRPDAGK